MITPMDIHNKTFSGQIRGYSKDEVNAFLEELASDYEKIYREHRAMEEEMTSSARNSATTKRWSRPCPTRWSWHRKPQIM